MPAKDRKTWGNSGCGICSPYKPRTIKIRNGSPRTDRNVRAVYPCSCDRRSTSGRVTRSSRVNQGAYMRARKGLIEAITDSMRFSRNANYRPPLASQDSNACESRPVVDVPSMAVANAVRVGCSKLYVHFTYFLLFCQYITYCDHLLYNMLHAATSKCRQSS